MTTFHSRVERAAFQSVIDGKKTDLYYLKNKHGLEISVTNFGARIVEFWTPDKSGRFEDIVLGHATLDAYVHYVGERFFGSTIGRYANRIAGARFTLDGNVCRLPANDGGNSLHGGDKGFDMVVWDVVAADAQRIVFRYRSEDGEQGFPGTLDVGLAYELDDDGALTVTHTARTDKRTVVNLTHHSFFNLHGAGVGTVNDHLLTICADGFTPVDATLIPTGEIAPVEDTPFDFRTPTLIGARVDDASEQLRLGHGYDHNWVLRRETPYGLERAAELYEPVSGRWLEVWTTEPGMQFYGGNFLDGTIRGKGGLSYGYRGAVALETQHFPDSPNQPGFPSTVLEPDAVYNHVCVYKTGVK